MAGTAFVPTAEAAFIAGLSDKQIQRVVDEHIIEMPLIQQENGRRYARLAAAFAKFYFDFEDVLTAGARRDAIKQVAKRVLDRSDVADLMALNISPLIMSWDVEVKQLQVTFLKHVVDAQSRAAQVDAANRAIVEDEAILGGVPVFQGTRVPVDTVVAMARSEQAFASLQDHYPFLTPQLLQAAEIYQSVHPRRGRPTKAISKDWNLRSRKTIRSGTKAA